ncbi:MAG: hypothetical protein OEZ36_10410, partial [Spirochaetota bacterium]|nr:hypothetical protein [Spirochaetota bacterium]
METNKLKKFRRALFRYLLYGGILVFSEVAFYTVTKIGKLLPDFISWFFDYGWRVDPSLQLNTMWDDGIVPIKTLYGQASLWMFFVYATICLFFLEPAHKKLRGKSWILRGTIYMSIILFMECSLGWVLYWLTGYMIWYYDDPLNIFTFTSLSIAPMWFVVGLVSENVSRLVFALTRS